MNRKAKGYSLFLVALLLICLAFCLVSANFKPAPLPALKITSSGEIFPSSDLIQRDGNVYTLTRNWSSTYMLQVERSNIIIQGGGFSIIGNTIGYGMRLLGVSNVAVHNINIKNALLGIYLQKSSKITIDSCNVDVGNEGIYLNQSTSNTIINNKLYGFYGIYLDHSANNVLRNNSIQASSKNFMVVGDSLSDYINDIDSTNLIDGQSIIYWAGRQNAVVPPNSSYIALINCKQIIVQNQHISNSQGILLGWTTNSTVSNNDLHGNFYGIQVLHSSNIMIRENRIWGNNGLAAGGDGIYIDNSQFVTAENNQVSDNWNGGITCNNSSKNLLTQNSISDNRHNGINFLSSSDYNLIAQNQLSNHETDSRGAIYIENSRNNNFVFNNLTDNGCWAIQLKGNQGNNTFYGNNFIHNSYRNTRSNPCALQISTPGTANGNNWDNGSLGNYWSDYDGSGKYVINENNIDHYPQSTQVDVSSIAPIPTIDTGKVPLSIDPIIAILSVIGIISVFAVLTLFYRRHRKTLN
jgi:parallel beta-helix repeat protein